MGSSAEPRIEEALPAIEPSRSNLRECLAPWQGDRLQEGECDPGCSMLLGGKRMKMAFGLAPLVAGALAHSHFSREDVRMNSLGMGQGEGV